MREFAAAARSSQFSPRIVIDKGENGAVTAAAEAEAVAVVTPKAVVVSVDDEEEGVTHSARTIVWK